MTYSSRNCLKNKSIVCKNIQTYLNLINKIIKTISINHHKAIYDQSLNEQFRPKKLNYYYYMH